MHYAYALNILVHTFSEAECSQDLLICIAIYRILFFIKFLMICISWYVSFSPTVAAVYREFGISSYMNYKTGDSKSIKLKICNADKFVIIAFRRKQYPLFRWIGNYSEQYSIGIIIKLLEETLELMWLCFMDKKPKRMIRRRSIKCIKNIILL